MKTKQLFNLLTISFLISSCSISSFLNPPKEEEKTPQQEKEPEQKKEEDLPDEALLNAKNSALNEINNFVNLDNYRDAEKNQIQDYIGSLTKIINAAKTVDDVTYFLELYEEYIMALKTDSQYKREALEKCVTTAQITEYKKLGYKTIYKDSNYLKGYEVSKPVYGAGENPYHTNYLKTFDVSGKPYWSIAQWTSKYDILGTKANDGYTLSQDVDGVINKYTSKGKMVNDTFVPAKVITANSKTGELYLECNCSVEYDSPRTGSEGWVHLLYGQDFGNNLVNVSQCTSIVMEAEFTVNKCVNHTGTKYDVNKHAAQLVWYITMQNRTGGYENPDFGKYIWFGIGLWDNRTAGKVAGMYRAHDAGTDTLIYNPSSTDYFIENNGKQPNIGERAKAKIDIRPIAREAFEYAKANNYLGNTKFEDLYIGGTNFGYEVPGTFDIGSTIHAINVFYK